MKNLEKGQTKIDKICAILKEETLQPAQKEAQEIIERAQKKAEQIISDAEKAAEKLHLSAKASIEHEKTVFYASLAQASNQVLESLRQSIEKTFFSDHLSAVIQKNSADPGLIAKLINTIVKALEKDGLSANLSVIVPHTMTPRQLNELLLDDVLKTLKEHSVVLGDISSGIKLKLHDKQMTIDLSGDALKELLATYIARKDFRKLLFGTP